MVATCPICSGTNLYGPVSDYWGVCCVDCGYELQPEPKDIHELDQQSRSEEVCA